MKEDVTKTRRSLGLQAPQAGAAVPDIPEPEKAEEAAAKALGRGLFGLRPDQLEVLWDEQGAPVLRLHGAAAESYGGWQLALSIAHSGGMAVAFCVATKTQGA